MSTHTFMIIRGGLSIKYGEIMGISITQLIEYTQKTVSVDKVTSQANKPCIEMKHNLCEFP
jgi:hypothetical protein